MNSTEGKKISSYDFRQQVIEALLPQKLASPHTLLSASCKQKSDETEHTTKESESCDNRNRLLRKDSQMSRKAEQKIFLTLYYCDDRSDKPGLHPDEPFTNYHKNWRFLYFVIKNQYLQST